MPHIGKLETAGCTAVLYCQQKVTTDNREIQVLLLENPADPVWSALVQAS
jgi:hypothetical protein